MNSKEILNSLHPVFKEIFREEIELNLSTSPREIGQWDSLNHILLIKKIEEKFQVEFDLFDIIEFKNVGDIVSSIQKYSAQPEN